VAIHADAPSASSTRAVLLVVFIWFYLSLVLVRWLPDSTIRTTRCGETNGGSGQIVFSWRGWIK
jgi:hypothetical protein